MSRRLPVQLSASLVALLVIALLASGCATSSEQLERAGGPPDLAEQGDFYGHDEQEYQEFYEEDEFADPFEDPFATEEVQQIADPIEPVNRVMFLFNDILYHTLLKPVKFGYRWAVPETARIGVGNFFHNLGMPVRALNALLQLKVDVFGAEVMAFVVNTIAGFGGFMDLSEAVGLKTEPEDFGQTLGRYGLGHGAYLYLPMIGPTSLRDGVGVYVDWYADPVKYTSFTFSEYLAVVGGRKVNTLSLDKDTYESIIADQIDPYLFIRNAYVQYRRAKVAK